MDIAEGAILLSQDFLKSVAMDKEITGQIMRVLFIVLSELEFENYIRIRQVDIAHKLEMQKGDVSKAMKQLVAKGIILKVKEGTTTGYKLNPHYGWKGKVVNRDKEIKRIVVDLAKERKKRDLSPK